MNELAHKSPLILEGLPLLPAPGLGAACQPYQYKKRL